MACGGGWTPGPGLFDLWGFSWPVGGELQECAHPQGPARPVGGFPEKACQTAEVLRESAGLGEVWGNTGEE